MTLSLLQQLTEKYQGVLVDYAQDGIIVLDRSGTRMVYSHIADSELDRFERIQAFFKSVPELNPTGDVKREDAPKPLDLTVHLDATYFERNTDSEFRALCVLLRGLASGHAVTLVLHFSQSPKQLEKMLSGFFKLINPLMNTGSVIVYLAAAFDKPNEKDLTFLRAWSIRLHYVAPLRDDPRLTADEQAVVYSYADRGFRIPIAWRVHEQNCGIVFDIATESLAYSYDSGFMLPLASMLPFSVSEKESNLNDPDLMQYIQLLMKAYTAYPFYDDVFFPINKILSKVTGGNRSEALSIPRIVNIRIHADGLIDFYANSPSRSVVWGNLSDVVHIDNRYLVSMFAGFLTVPARSNRSCTACEYHSLCGGEFGDGVDQRICELNRFFLKAFLWERMKMHVFLQQEKDAK